MNGKQLLSNSIYIFIDFKFGEFLEKAGLKRNNLLVNTNNFLKKVEKVDGFYFPKASLIDLNSWMPTVTEKSKFNHFAALQILGFQNLENYFIDLETEKEILNTVFQGNSGPPWWIICYIGYACKFSSQLIVEHLKGKKLEEVYRKFRGGVNQDIFTLFGNDSKELFSKLESDLNQTLEYNLSVNNLEKKKHFYPFKDTRSGDINFDILFQSEEPSDLIIEWIFNLAYNASKIYIKTH